jgi:hypothetical protein
MNTQYHWDSDIEKCDSPRLATVPILNEHLDWALGGVQNDWPNGSSDPMKIIGFNTVYVREPNTIAEMSGIDFIVPDVIWFGPNATCDDQPENFYGGPSVKGGIKLVAS